MAKIQYGIPQGLNAQGLSHEQIAQLLLRAQTQGGADPSDVAGYDTVGTGGPSQHGPVYSVGQGIANAVGDIGTAYLKHQQEKKMLAALAAQNDANSQSTNRGLAIAMSPGITQHGVQAASGNFQPDAQSAFPGGQNVPGVNGDPFSKFTPARPAFDPTPLDDKQRTLAAFKSFGPNSQLAAQMLPTLASASQAAEPDSFTGTLKGDESAYIKGKQVAQGSPVPDSPAAKADYDFKRGLITKEVHDAIIAKETGQDPVTLAHLRESNNSADLSGERLAQLKTGQLDDDAVEFRAHLAAAGDPSAYQGIPKSIYGSSSIAKIGNRAAALATESAKAEGLSPDEAARRQAQVNIAFKGAQKAYGVVATTGAQKDQVAIEMGKLGDQLAEVSKNVSRTGWVPINSLENYARSNTDKPEYGKLAVAVQGFKTAYAQALVRGGQSTDSARAHSDALFSDARNDEDLMARVRQAQKEIGAVLESTSETKSNVLSGVGGGTSTPTKAAPALPGAAASPAAPAVDYKAKYGLTGK